MGFDNINKKGESLNWLQGLVTKLLTELISVMSDLIIMVSNKVSELTTMVTRWITELISMVSNSIHYNSESKC